MRGKLSLLARRLRRARGPGRELEVGLESMFQPVRFGRLPTEEVRVVGAPGRPRVYRRLERVESAFTEIPELHLDLPRRSWLSVTGAQTDGYALVLWAETDSEQQTDAIVERTDFRRNGDTWALGVPPELLTPQVVCRADLGRAERRRKDGRVVCTYGAGPPQLRLISQTGNIVIDNPVRDDDAR